MSSSPNLSELYRLAVPTCCLRVGGNRTEGMVATFTLMLGQYGRLRNLYSYHTPYREHLVWGVDTNVDDVLRTSLHVMGKTRFLHSHTGYPLTHGSQLGSSNTFALRS